MAIEHTESGTMIVTGEHIELFQLMRAVSALALEINTGMKMSHKGSAMLLCASLCGSPKRTKKGVLLDLVCWTKANWPSYTPAPSAKKALGDVRMSKKLRKALDLELS